MNRINKYNQPYRFIFFLFFLILSTGSVLAQDSEKRITIQNKDISLKEVFKQIEQQTGYSIAYEQSAIDTSKEISLSLKNATIDQALTQIVKDSRLTYKITGYHIIISLKSEKSMNSQPTTEKPVQNIRGVVIDSKTNAPVEYATVTVANHPSLGAVTDGQGRFTIKNVPVGRYSIETTFMGYNPSLTSEVLVSSSKEVNLQITLTENVHYLNEVVVLPEVKKDETLNPMAITGGRMISMEEASRFANGFDDPARLTSAFAGVAGDVGTNAIAVRGNSPMFTQWRLEGVEIPNPTHYADLAGLGGGFLSALSTQVIGNSDFYNGAFPAEYSNALSGIFDMHLRNGNNQQFEHTFQAGLMGIDLASEGPFSRKQGSSYIFNYRFSTSTLATGGDYKMEYQDLSFKLNFPTKYAGTFSFWGLALRDRNKFDAEDSSDWETLEDRQSGDNQMDKVVGGLNHKYMINESTYIRSSLTGTYSRDYVYVDQHSDRPVAIRVADIKNSKWNMVFNSYLNKKFSSRHINRTGITVTGLKYDLNYRVSPNFGLDVPMEQISKGDGQSMVVSAFSNSVIDLTKNLTASIGIATQYFKLNDNWSVEPRAALKWQFNPRHSIAAAYGLNSRRENLDYYYVEQNMNGKKESNRFLDFSKSHHFGLSYDWRISSNLHLKVEPYYQYLYDIPVEKNSSFSIINHGDFYMDRLLVNDGLGKNYGIDITLESYMKNGFYYMLTGSIFKSKYRGGDDIWRNTRMDKGFLVNAVAGKEWMVGKRKQNVFSINGRVVLHGGERYTPVDIEKSNELHEIFFDETRAYSKKFSPAVNGDISINYRINRKKISHEFSVKILNVGVNTGMHYYHYNEKKHEIEKIKGMGLIPNISYKIYF